MVHHSLGQVLIRQGWEASLLDVGLNKFVRVASAPRSILKANNTWFEKDLFLPQKCAFWGLRGNPHLPPSAFIVLSLSKGVHNACAVFETCSHHTHYSTPFLRPSAYKARVGGISPRCEIEQIRESGISSSAHSQSEQYLIGERFVHPTISFLFY